MTHDGAGPASERVRVRRLAELARYERTAVDAVLDAGIVAHVGVVTTGGPLVVPMVYARIDDDLYLHGSVASRLLRHLRAEPAVCVQVTTVDGVLLARSAFNTSLAYRSATIFGDARVVDDARERTSAFRAILHRLVPGHWDDVRPPNRAEEAQTMVVAVPIGEASAKVSVGPPDDEAEDLALAHWAGEIPLSVVAGEPIPAPGVTTPVPKAVAGFVPPPARGA